MINVNDHDELTRLIRITATAPSRVDIGLRLSSTLPRLGQSRFGFSLENSEAASAAERVRDCSGLKLSALHTHLYGDTDDAAMYGLAASRLGDFAKQHVSDYQRTLRFVDMGGGFPAHGTQPKSRQTWDPQPIDVYVKTIADALRDYFPDENRRPILILEPGRYLTCDGILHVTQVVHAKERDGTQLVNCNGSISMVPLTHYCPQIIRAYSSELVARDEDNTRTIVYGSTCRENDILYEGDFPTTRPGDYLIHFAAGAYNSSLSPDFIFESPSLELF